LERGNASLLLGGQAQELHPLILAQPPRPSVCGERIVIGLAWRVGESPVGDAVSSKVGGELVEVPAIHAMRALY
jgi:hypothetical protein